MANTLTAILPVIYEAADVISRELTGFIPACFRNSSAARAAKDQSVNYPVVGAMTAADATPSNVSSTGTDQTVGSGEMKITKVRKVSFNWTGEESQALSAGDVPQGQNVMRDQFAQAMRTLVNEIENDLWLAAYKGASRGYGTAGTTPFGTANDLSDFAGVLEILEKNGCPAGDRHLVVGSAAMANLRGKQSVLFKVNEAGNADLLRRGVVGEVQGLMVHNSHPIATHTKGTGSGYLINNASGEAVGETTITTDTGTGTIIPGDIVTFAGTSHKYVVNTALASNDFVIGKPGLLVLEADNDAITVGNNYVPNVAFDRNALHLITRAPALPQGGDSADDMIEIVDPQTGLAFQVAVYRQYLQASYEVRMAWGVKAVKSDHIAILLG